VLLRAKSEGVDIDTSVRVASVVLVRLDKVEVGSLALGEAVLTVKLELGSHDRVLTPAVEVKSSLGKHESASVRDTRVDNTSEAEVRRRVGTVSAISLIPVVVRGRDRSILSKIYGTSVIEDTIGVDKCLRVLSNTIRATESMDCVRKHITGISVVERLGTKKTEEVAIALKRRAVVDTVILLDNPDKLLHGVVEVKLDLVGRRTNRLVTVELKLLNKVLMRVLGHLAALISIKEDVVNIERSSNKRLVVCVGDLAVTSAVGKRADSPQALVNGTDIKVDLGRALRGAQTWRGAEESQGPSTSEKEGSVM